MCGIAGFSRDPMRPADADCAIVRRMLDPIAHRGPDGEGIHVAGPIAFGHLRLAIIDLAGGQQPRVDAVTEDALVFNGEIYGYAALAAELTAAGVDLVDRSDTEVLFRLLQRVGVAATLEKIDGMFAFAFFEGRTGRLYLARDRFGEKPLYWCARDGVLIFGSEPSAVLAHPLARDLPIDLGAVHKFLAYEYLPGTHGFHRELRIHEISKNKADTPQMAIVYAGGVEFDVAGQTSFVDNLSQFLFEVLIVEFAFSARVVIGNHL